jgi:hypothetical protein
VGEGVVPGLGRELVGQQLLGAGAFVSSIDVVFLAAGVVMVLALVLATRLRLPSSGSYGPHGSGGPVDQRAVVPVGAEQ